MTHQQERDPEVAEALAVSVEKLRRVEKLQNEINAVAREIRRRGVKVDPHGQSASGKP